jgi:transposase
MLGIDVSKKDLSCALLDPATRRTLWQGSVPNSAAGLQELLARTPQESPWVVEPTGRYSSMVVQLGLTAGRQVLLAQPQKARCFLRSIQSRAKTDQLDSRGLALYGLAHSLPPYPVKPALVEQLDQLLAARKGIAAHLSSLQLQLGELPHAAAPLQAAITALQQQRQELDRQIAALTTGAAGKEHFPAAVRLQAVPGIGPITAAAMVSRLTAKQFGHPDQFVAYVGLDIGVRQSGKRAGNVGLTKQGDAELRRLLYLCAQANLRCKNSPFKAQYERELAKGLSRTGALCAVARKLARLCWSMVKHGSEYDPARVYQQELPKAQK